MEKGMKERKRKNNSHGGCKVRKGPKVAKFLDR